MDFHNLKLPSGLLDAHLVNRYYVFLPMCVILGYLHIFLSCVKPRKGQNFMYYYACTYKIE